MIPAKVIEKPVIAEQPLLVISIVQIVFTNQSILSREIFTEPHHLYVRDTLIIPWTDFLFHSYDEICFNQISIHTPSSSGSRTWTIKSSSGQQSLLVRRCNRLCVHLYCRSNRSRLPTNKIRRSGSTLDVTRLVIGWGKHIEACLINPADGVAFGSDQAWQLIKMIRTNNKKFFTNTK